MIVFEDERHTKYHCFAAFIETMNDESLCRVGTKDETLAYLKQNPDKDHLLVPEPGLARLLQGEVDDSTVVYCGKVRWDSRRNDVASERFVY